jgi:GTPase
LYHQRIDSDRITTPELAQKLGAISTEINQPVTVYINRRGQIIRVGVGSLRETQIPLLELPRYGSERLSGIRCLTTQLSDQPPKESCLTSMTLQRLDALAVFNLTGQGITKKGGTVTGYIKQVYLAHLLPQSQFNENPEAYWAISSPQTLEALAKQDFIDFVEALEEEFRREFIAQDVDGDQDRVILVGLLTNAPNSQQFSDRITELTRLVDTAGGEVLATLIQQRARADSQTVVGSGKVEEIALKVQTLGANLVVFDRELSPTQVRNLERQIGVRVIDRTELILDIFAQRAQSQAGKLQVELAQLEHSLPHLTGQGEAMSRLGGGIGTRGPGETKLETQRREIQRRVTKLQQEVNQLQSHRSRLRQQRQKQDIPTIAIVGYTNAGKSTLLNALTNSEVYVADQLFATLDPTTRKVAIINPTTQNTQTILLTDTVGFIHELPPSLVDAFRATLEEVTEADGLLHLVDLSHPAWESQIESVMKILEEITLTPPLILLGFNKIDQVDQETLEYAKINYPNGIFLSAFKRFGLETLRQKLAQLLE